MFICLAYILDNFLELIGIDRRDQHPVYLIGKAAFALDLGDAMAACMEDRSADFIRHIGHNIQCGQLIALVHGIDDLCGNILEDDGIQGNRPAIQTACNDQNHRIGCQHVVPCFLVEFHRQPDRDEVSAAAGGI